MAFDPNAATARYIDSLGPAALQKAHDYTVGKEWMLLWGLLVAAVVTWLIVRSGVLDRLDAQDRRAAAATCAPSSSAWSIFLVSAVLTLPWTHLRQLVPREELWPHQPAARRLPRPGSAVDRRSRRWSRRCS